MEREKIGFHSVRGAWEEEEGQPGPTGSGILGAMRGKADQRGLSVNRGLGGDAVPGGGWGAVLEEWERLA